MGAHAAPKQQARRECQASGQIGPPPNRMRVAAGRDPKSERRPSPWRTYLRESTKFRLTHPAMRASDVERMPHSNRIPKRAQRAAEELFLVIRR